MSTTVPGAAPRTTAPRPVTPPAAPGPLSLTVTALDDTVPGIRTLVLSRADGALLPSFTPGSHLVLDCGPVRNAYSLTGPTSRPDHYRISVQRHDDGAGGSRWVHERVSLGDTVVTGVPRSLFAPAARATHHVYVAGGIGVTPLLSHARAAARWHRSFEFVYAAHPGRAAHLDELRALCGARLTLVAHRDELRRLLDDRLADRPIGTYLYTCGPDAMMAAVAATAERLGWPAERVRQERFGAAALDPGDPFDAVLARSGRRVRVDSGRSLLDALDAAGVTVPRMCRQGVCGECRVGVHSGELVHRDLFLDDDEKAAGTAMMCCVSRATGEVTLEL